MKGKIHHHTIRHPVEVFAQTLHVWTLVRNADAAAATPRRARLPSTKAQWRVALPGLLHGLTRPLAPLAVQGSIGRVFPADRDLTRLPHRGAQHLGPLLCLDAGGYDHAQAQQRTPEDARHGPPGHCGELAAWPGRVLAAGRRAAPQGTGDVILRPPCLSPPHPVVLPSASNRRGSVSPTAKQR